MDLVLSGSTGALQALLPELAKLLKDEYKLQTSVKDGIRYLQRELETMQVALEKVSEVPSDQLDPLVKIWARNVRDMSYRIQDSLDSFMVRIDAGGEFGSSTPCCLSAQGILPWTCKARHDIATEIELIKDEVKEVSSCRERYKFDGMPVREPYDPRLSALYKDKLVGIDHSSQEIIKLLSVGDEEGTSEQKPKLVSIVGPAGMGKTTLANAVYQKLEEKFDCTAFVSVSLQPNMKNILNSILYQVTSKISDDPEDKDKDKHKDKSLQRGESKKKYHGRTETGCEKEIIINKIRHVLQKRRYLIVIDDIWGEEPWELIECVLVDNNLGSKVITTTRKKNVAKSCCSSEKVDGIFHQLEPLSGGDSKQLFYYKIFGKEGCPPELEVVSQKILEKCKGWPLAIVTIASVLANKPAKTENQWSIVYNSISTGLDKDNKRVKDMRSILSLSYRDMPSQLRACLLYLSIFPEDHIIGRDDLIRRWIAEDLVHGRECDNLYDLGDKYFNELINRSMLQPIDVDAFGRAHACKIHDLVLEFVTSLSAEEDFVTILNGMQPFPSQPDSIHRLSLRNSKGEHGIPQATKRLPRVRTLVVSSSAIDSMPPLSIFPVLRVLELEHCTSRNIESVGNLVHLRYLRLSQEYFGYHFGRCIKLPKTIGSLQLLQTLDLKEARIEELPSTVVRLRQLRLLEILLPKWDKKCENRLLQCLCSMKQIEALCIIAPDLSLDFMLQVDWAPSRLQRFRACPRERTQHILRRGSVWAELSPFSTLPSWINSSLCSSLSDLSIMVRKLGQADVELLADLPILRSVDLEVVEATGSRLEINRCVGTTSTLGGHAQATAFRCLENLKFASRAAGMVFKPGAMQKLQKLYLCFDLAETKDVHGDFDLGLEKLASLKTVNIEIDCRCARLWEVEAAEAALVNATKMNPNFPSLDLTRHFQGDMLWDEDEEILGELRANKKEDALLSRVGPFGGHGGRARDISLAPHRLRKVTIRSGDIVDSIKFSYTDQNEQQHTAGPWGGSGGSVSTEINLGPSDYLIKVSGTIGSFYELADVVTSLTFVTNTASHGPFGKGGGDPFVLQGQSNSSIVGFFGRAGGSLDAIGFYVRPL